MNTVTVEDLGDLGLYTLQPERQRNVVGKLTMIGVTRKDVELMLAEAQGTCSDTKIALAILSKLLNGTQQDLLTAVLQLRKREEKKKQPQAVSATYAENLARQQKINEEFEADQRRIEAEKAAGTYVEPAKVSDFLKNLRLRKVD